nr:MAG TPA: hypothetical protein [Bacteriophage sp.]
MITGKGAFLLKKRTQYNILKWYNFYWKSTIRFFSYNL